jgi:hypothetical protein
MAGHSWTEPNPWAAPPSLPRSTDDVAVEVDVTLREDYDDAQRIARLRATHRGRRQHVARRLWRDAPHWTVRDVEFAVLRPGWLEMRR